MQVGSLQPIADQVAIPQSNENGIMFEFFQGWRRNVGVVTLLLACVFSAGLVRSLFIGDSVAFFTGDLTGETFTSENCYLEWASWRISKNPQRALPPRTSFVKWNRYPLGKDHVRPDENEGISCRFRCLLFGFGNGGGSLSLAYAHRIWFLSYWVVVIPLTLLSACFLLAKPRSSIPKNITESISIMGVPSRFQCKTGFVMLLLVCVLIGWWVRSFYFADRFGFSEDFRRLHFCESINGSIRWICFDVSSEFGDGESNEPDNGVEVGERMQEEEENAEVELVEPTYHGWQVTSRRREPSHFVTADHPDSGYRLTFQFMGFGDGKTVSIDGAKSVPGTIWFIPFWSIVIPLTLISLWLLLSKLRPPPPKKTPEPIPEKVA